jgi:hypothetical protein
MGLLTLFFNNFRVSLNGMPMSGSGPSRRAVGLLMTAGLLLTACGAGGDDVDPSGAFDAVDDGAEASDGSGAPTPASGPEDSNPEETVDDVGGPDGSSEGSGGSPDPAPVVTADSGGAGVGGDDESRALAVWDEFLTVWGDLRNGDVTRDGVEAVAVLDEAMAELVDGSLEADTARGTTTVELYGGTRSEIAVAGPTVTFVDCVYEKALGTLPWVLAQRWDVTVGLTAGPDGAPAVTGLTQRAAVGDDGEIVFDVCLNPVLEDEVVAVHIALREMYAQVGADPAAGIDDPRIDALLGSEAASDFRSSLEGRIAEGTSLRDGYGENIRIAVFSHQLNIARTIACEDQREGFARVDASANVVASTDPSLQTITTARLAFSTGGWVASETTSTNDAECGDDPLSIVNVVGESEIPAP